METNPDDHDLGEQKHAAGLLKPLFAAISLIILAMAWLITTSTPGEGGPMVILLFLLLTFFLALFVSMVALRISERLTALRFSWLRILYTSVAVAAGIVFLVGLRTLRQLQVVDVVLVVTFELLLNFYLLRRF